MQVFHFLLPSQDSIQPFHIQTILFCHADREVKIEFKRFSEKFHG